MKHKLWLVHAALILFFAGTYILYSFGQRGELRGPYLHNQVFPTLQRVAVFFSDLKLRLRGTRSVQNRIAILEINGDALDRVGRWPWRRDMIAWVVKKAYAAGAKAVGVDIVFSEPQVSVPEELVSFLQEKRLGEVLSELDFDAQLAATVRKYQDRLVLGWFSESNCLPAMSSRTACPVHVTDVPKDVLSLIEPFLFGGVQFNGKFEPSKTPVLTALDVTPNIELISRATRHAGFLNASRDADGLIRRTRLVMMVNGEPYPNFALELASVVKGDPLVISFNKKAAVEQVGYQKQKGAIPVLPTGTASLNLRGPHWTFPYVSVPTLLTAVDDDMKVVNAAAVAPLKDAVVLLGMTALGGADMVATPFDREIPGVEIHATLLDNLLSGDLLRTEGTRWGFWAILFLMSVGGVAFSQVTQRLGGLQTLLGFGVVFAATVLVDTRVLFASNIDIASGFLYLEWLGIVGTSLVAKYLQEERNKNFLRSAFSKYVAPAVVDAIVSNPSSLSLGGRKAPVTVFFSDLRGFTSFAEKIDGSHLVEYLNEYFTLMTDVLFSYQGTLDKFIGDSVMAFWGAPLSQADHAVRACEAAVAMVRKVDHHRARLKAKYGYETRMGIGIHSGVVTVGNLGSEKNVNFTVIGDGVNLASRLQSATKMFGAEILTSRETLEGIRAAGFEPPAHRLLGEVWLKGKAKPIEVAEVLSSPIEAGKLAAFSEGRALLEEGKWELASEKFKLAGAETDPVCRAFLKRCEEYLQNPQNAVAHAWVMAA